MSTTVIHFNDVVHIAADMQTQSTVRDDKVQANASQHNTIVINDTINDESSTNSPTFDVSKQLCGIQSRSRGIVTYNRFHEEACWYSVHDGTDDIYCFVQPRTCNYGNQCAAQFPEGIIINYEERKIISLDITECSHMVSLHNQAGDVMYVTSRSSVHDNPVTESYVQWHLSSYFDFMTDKRMTFDEFIAEHGILSLQPKKPVSTMNVVDQFGRADNIMCKMYQTSQDYLLHQLKHYSEAVKDIKRNSIGTRPSSSQATEYCPSLTPDRTTNSNSNIVLKAGIMQKMLSIKSKSSIDKIKSDVMRVADSILECVKFDHALNELRSSPRNFTSKIDNLTHSDYIANELSIDGLKVLGTGLDHHKICIENIKALLLPSKSDQHRPDGITMISNMVKDVVSGTSPDTCSKDTSMSWDCEVRDEEPRERPLTRSIARTSSFTTPSPVPSSENQTGQEDQPLRFVTNYCGSSKPPVPMSPTRITSSGKRRGYNNYLRKTIASSTMGRASNDIRTTAQRYGRMSLCMPLIAGASLHHGLPGLRKKNDGEMCSYNLIRRTTRTYLQEDVEPDTGSIDSGRTCRRRRGTTKPLRDRGDLPRLARPEGCFAARRSPLRGKAGEPV
jgi:hypothetical protein